jgi:hypothetical protein
VSLNPRYEDVMRFEFDALRAIAARVIDEHVNDYGTCRACGGEFPCPQACLAEHNLVACDCGCPGRGLAQVGQQHVARPRGRRGRGAPIVGLTCASQGVGSDRPVSASRAAGPCASRMDGTRLPHLTSCWQRASAVSRIACTDCLVLPLDAAAGRYNPRMWCYWCKAIILGATART